ncbi:MAG: DUF1080 domain-containing protein [Planctomycetia bacterium]|nr:DUF1080 domain-containing protein [Planctomycetia bacterium]
MKKRLFPILSLISAVILGMTATTVAVAEEAENAKPERPEGVALFENVTLDDFDCFLVDNGKKEEVYKLEDGILKVSGTPFGWLATKEKYRNFALSVEVRYPTDNKNANSGLFLRITETEEALEPKFLPPCIECQLQTQNIGHLFGFHGHTLNGAADRYTYRAKKEGGVAELHKLMNAKNNQLEGTEAWNKVDVFCHNDLILVLLNGKLVNWATNATNVAGTIGFQSEGGEIWFRNAKLYVPAE